MKKYFITALIVLLTAPVWAIAANDVSVSDDIIIDLSNDSLVLKEGSIFDSFSVNSDNIVFTVSANSQFQLTSSAKKNFSVNLSSGAENYINHSVTCDGINSLLNLEVSALAALSYTVTVAPFSTANCSFRGGIGGMVINLKPIVNGDQDIISSLDSMSSDGKTVSLPDEVSQIINGVSGGTATLSDNSLSVTVPANSLGGNFTLTITPQRTFAQPKAGYGAVGSRSYNISAITSTGLNLTQFNNQLSLNFSYTNSQIEDFEENTLVASYWSVETGQWVDLPTIIDPVNNQVTATTNHLSKFILQAKAKGVPPGSLIKAAGKTTVYYLGHNNKRYVFPDQKIFYSWYQNFKDVMTVTPAELAFYDLAGNITVRPGTKLIQFVGYSRAGAMVVDDPKVYAVEPDGRLRWIITPEIAESLYGSYWEQRIIPVNNVLAGNYFIGAVIESVSYPTGSLVTDLSNNVLYYISGTQKRMVTAAGRTANRLVSSNYLEAADLSAYETISALNDYQNSIGWTGGK